MRLHGNGKQPIYPRIEGVLIKEVFTEGKVVLAWNKKFQIVGKKHGQTHMHQITFSLAHLCEDEKTSAFLKDRNSGNPRHRAFYRNLGNEPWITPSKAASNQAQLNVFFQFGG